MDNKMRRKDREVTSQQEMIEIIGRCDVCRLAFNGPDALPYILPLNFGMSHRDGKLTLYFHSADAGMKTAFVKEGAQAAFEMDTRHEIYYQSQRGYCTFHYESVMGHGRIRIIDDSEKMAALALLMDHYHPGENAYFNPAAVPHTLVYALEVEQMTAKHHLPPMGGGHRQ